MRGQKLPFLLVTISCLSYFPGLCQNALAGCTIDRGSGFRSQDFNIPYPEKIEAILTPLQPGVRMALTHACSTQPEYLESMKRLEKAVVHSALMIPSPLEEMKELNLRLLAWINRLVEVRLIVSLKREPKDSEIAAKTDALLKVGFGQCDPIMPGCVGADPAVIRESFRVGNLRERFYLSWNTAYGVLLKYFGCGTAPCACSPQISGRLRMEKTPDREILEFCRALGESRNVLGRGRFGKTPEFFRRHRPSFNKEVSRFHPQDLEPPLSEREVKLISSQNSGENWQENLVLSTGVGNFTPLSPAELDIFSPEFPDPHNYYYSAAKRFGFSIAVSISGSTDNLINLGCILGIDSLAEQERLRMAAIAYMIPHRHHSIYEVLTATKAFSNLDIFPNSDFYKKVFRTQSNFEDLVVQEYHKASVKDPRLPTDIYAECLSKTAMPVAKKGGESMTRAVTSQKPR